MVLIEAEILFLIGCQVAGQLIFFDMFQTLLYQLPPVTLPLVFRINSYYLQVPVWKRSVKVVNFSHKPADFVHSAGSMVSDAESMEDSSGH